MKTIYKHPINVFDFDWQTVDTYEGAEVRHFGVDPEGRLCVWVEADTSRVCAQLHLVTIRTGQAVPDGIYLASVVLGAFVWHLYQEMT